MSDELDHLRSLTPHLKRDPKQIDNTFLEIIIIITIIALSEEERVF